MTFRDATQRKSCFSLPLTGLDLGAAIIFSISASVSLACRYDTANSLQVYLWRAGMTLLIRATAVFFHFLSLSFFLFPGLAACPRIRFFLTDQAYNMSYPLKNTILWTIQPVSAIK